MLKNLKGKFIKSKSVSHYTKNDDPKGENNDEENLSTSKPFVPEKPVTMAIIGAGSRGQIYADYAKMNPWMLTIVAVCDTVDYKCQKMAEDHNIPPENTFIGDWHQVTMVPKLADAVAICTVDREHVGPAEAFADLKYHILLEKPMSVTMDECVRIYEAVNRNNVLLAVSHILRYTMYVRCLKKIINSGILGDIINIQQVEMIGHWHFAHSYVRGNWHKESMSSFSLLTKCCADIDVLAYLMDQRCTKISSFGSLIHFKKEKKPDEAGNAKKCLECPIQDSCVYSAKKIYIDRFNGGLKGWPSNVVQPKEPLDIENLTEALGTSDYGKCVYEMDNDVADHQVVNMEFKNGSTASLTMVAFTNGITRRNRIFGSLGELEGDFKNIKITDFRTGKVTARDPLFEMIEPGPNQWSGHGGGDFELARTFVVACATGDPSHILSGPIESLESHMYVFAAEESRRSGQTVDIELFRKKYVSEE